MKYVFILFACLYFSEGKAQVYLEDVDLDLSGKSSVAGFPGTATVPIYPVQPPKWKPDRNKYWTGGLIFLAGAAKGFNEGLQYQYNGFASFFPEANKQWFYPGFSFRNKYKDRDPSKGARFPFSTSLLVMVTDQYHLNNFI